jgi:hypothetical protein
VGGSAFTAATGIAPKLIVHDESRETATIGFFKYSNGFANHMIQGRARGSMASPANVLDNDVVAQYAGHGFLGGSFVKVGAVNMQVEGDGVRCGRTALLDRCHDGNGEPRGRARMDRRLRTLFEGALALRYESSADPGRPARLRARRSAHQRPPLRDGRVARVHRLRRDEDIDSPVAGELMIFINAGAADLVLENQSELSLTRIASSLAPGESALRPDQTATLFYDQTSARWRVLRLRALSATRPARATLRVERPGWTQRGRLGRRGESRSHTTARGSRCSAASASP